MCFYIPPIRRLLSIFFLPAAIVLAAEQPATTQRPNIVLIMADDMGFSDLGCYGSEIATPNLDRLAASGLRFTHFYNTSRCCPTRASLLTGLYSHQAGVGRMVGDYGVPSYQGYLSDQSVTIAEVLRPAGYRTLMVGKWHVGERRPHWPLDRGFDHYYGLITGGANYFDITKGKAPNVKRTMAIDNEPIIPEPGTFYITDAFTNHAVRMINSYGRQNKPFFLYVAYTAPHWPLHAWPKDIAKYRGKYMKGWDTLRKERHQRMIEMGLVDARWPLTPRDTEAPAWDDVEDKNGMDLKMSVYAAQIDRMDQGIGRILEQIRKIGAEENTLVMFLSDNGGCHESGPFGFDRRNNGVPCGGVDSYMSYGFSWANASNTPFRRYKHWVHEGGISTPLIAYWPGVIKKGGQITHEVGHVIDLMATCADVAGATYPETYKGKPIIPLEGKSLAPIFQEGQRAGHEVLYWEHCGNRAVRQGDWKLVSAAETNEWELYDLAADRTELNNVAAQHLDKLKELVNLYDAWAKKCGVLTQDEITKIQRNAKRNKAKQQKASKPDSPQGSVPGKFIHSPTFFPLLPWSSAIQGQTPELDRRHGLASIAECQFTIAGFVSPKDLSRCEELGLAAIVSYATNPFKSRKWDQITDEQIDTWVRDMIAATGKSPAVLGYYLADEPGTSAFPPLAKAVQAIRQLAPDKLAYINLFPGYATIGAKNQSQLEANSFTEYLERFVNEVKPDFLSYDNYMVLYSQDLRDPAVAARYYSDLLEVRRVANKYNLPFWNIVSSNQIRPYTSIPSPANLQFQAYTTLAAGGRGLSWYTYYGRGYSYAPIDTSMERTSTWTYLQMVNRHVRTLGPLMNEITSTGVFFTAPAPVEDFPLPPGRLVKAARAETPLMIGEFTGPEDTNAIMVVNLSLERSAHIEFDLQAGLGILHVVSPEDASPLPFKSEAGLRLTAGQGALLRIAPDTMPETKDDGPKDI